MIYHLIFISCLITLFCAEPAFAAPIGARDGHIEKILSQSVDNFELKGSDEFFRICQKLFLACGEVRYLVDWDLRNDLPPQRLPEATLRTILDAIVLRHPGYRWKIYGKTIVIEPIVSPKGSPLHKRIRKLELHKQNLYEAIPRAAKAAGVQFLGEAAYGGVFSKEEDERRQRSYRRQIDIKMTKATLQDILCAIVAAHGNSYWLFVHADPGDAVDLDSVSFAAY